MNDPIDVFSTRIAYERARLRTMVAAIEDDGSVVAALEQQRTLAAAVMGALSASASQLSITDTELQLLWFAAAYRVDPEIPALATRLLPESAFGLTTGTMRELVFRDRWSNVALREIGQDCRLSRYGLLETNANASDDESRQTWTVPNRVISWLRGENLAPEELCAPRVCCPPEALAIGAGANAELRDAMRGKGAVCVISGSVGSGRRSIVESVAADLKTDILSVDARRLAKDSAVFQKQLRHLARDCKLLAKAPLLCNIDALVDDKDQTRLDLVGTELVGELDTNVYVTCGVNRPQMRWDRPVIAIELKPPTSAQRAKLWRQLLTDASESDGEYLATQYPLAPAVMHRAAQAALARATGRKLTPDDITAGIRAVLDDRLGNFAKRVEVTQTWDDLVIEHEQAQSITELIARIRQRRTVYEQWGFAAKVGKGLGVSALFSGPPGTGKTMVAALIARELGLELYQVDMGKLVSKWIGETEKQLGEMFDAAEAGHAILLFDEADSLFGKRTEVRSSNDRYANLETNYLLQRLESFTGICLLTTNHESNIDPAFQRRLSLHLRFGIPDEDEREKLWRAMMPAAAPIEPSVDFAGLARRFAMTGGYIRNAALRAAFLAADEGTPIGSVHLEHAARLEYEGMGKIVTPPSTWPSRLSSAL